MDVAVRISRSALDRARAHAASDPAGEVCGLLLGDAAGIVEARPAANISPRAADRFEIDPAVLFAAHKAARNGGPALLGHYHSHPSGDVTPSPRDIEAAVPGQLWLILAPGGEAALFRAEAGGGFRRIGLDPW